MTLSKAYPAWLLARAATENATNDSQILAAFEVESIATWATFSKPAESFEEIRLRARMVGEIFMRAEECGEPTDGHHWVALSILLREIANYQVPA